MCVLYTCCVMSLKNSFLASLTYDILTFSILGFFNFFSLCRFCMRMCKFEMTQHYQGYSIRTIIKG